MNSVRKQTIPLSSVPGCTYTRASFLVEKLVRLAFKPGSLSRKNCQFFAYTRANKTCQGKLARLYGALIYSATVGSNSINEFTTFLSPP